DGQVSKLVGTTKPTIQAIRDRTHWNSANLTPIDPVTLGLCTQLELDLEVKKAAKNLPVVEEAEGAHLLPAEETTAAAADAEVVAEGAVDGAAESEAGSEPSEAPAEEMDIDPDSVFAKLKDLKSEDL
ncbi:MAG TPA: cell cycle transcriptional regulator TrcR, partial [Afifellaceae bacterium]|nr:cell cycle transcriptional regulator TrcR [Afifellaceae bacterium]